MARNLMLWVIVAIVLMAVFNALGPVSYTHLDVYKRQA